MDDEQRTKRVNVALSPSEYQELVDDARRRGLSKSALMRELLLAYLHPEEQQQGRDV